MRLLGEKGVGVGRLRRLLGRDVKTAFFIWLAD